MPTDLRRLVRTEWLAPIGSFRLRTCIMVIYSVLGARRRVAMDPLQASPRLASTLHPIHDALGDY
jgi:hypothetical protein